MVNLGYHLHLVLYFGVLIRREFCSDESLFQMTGYFKVDVIQTRVHFRLEFIPDNRSFIRYMVNFRLEVILDARSFQTRGYLRLEVISDERYYFRREVISDERSFQTTGSSTRLVCPQI
jgi:hypothetical protein